MADDPRALAFDPAAPAAERGDALKELTRTFMPTASGMIGADVFADIQASMDMLKAQVIPFPSDRARRPAGQDGMKSVALDELQVAMQGDYFDPPTLLAPEVARRMVDQTPLLSAIIMTRQRQVARFCQPSEDDGLGFAIRHVDAKHQASPEEEASIRNLTRFFQHTGWEFHPRKRKALGRDGFSTMMMKLTRDTLTLDRAPIEIEMKRDRSLGISGMYAIDGATFRLCPQGGWRGNQDIYALQVLNGRITTTYDAESIVFQARNPRADVRFGDYGFSELEVLVQTITGFLNAMTLNLSGFDKNSIPKGVVHLIGEYGTDDLEAFRRYWQAMVRGAANAWQLPFLVSKDPQSKASFEKFGVEFNEMYFGKWMTFLASLSCAVYSMDPSEVNFESFTNGASSLSGSDTAEKLAASKDKGLRPLLSYFEGMFTDYVCADFGDKYCFRFIGLDPKDAEKEHELRKMVLTVNEVRARLGEEAHEDETIGGAPVNPALLGLYQQIKMPQGGDFGGGGDFGQPDGGDDGGDGAAGGDPGDDAQGGDQTQGQAALDGGEQRVGAGASGDDFGKALTPIYTVGR